MAALILPSRRIAQPQQGAVIDWSNPLSSGLVLDVGANTAFRDSVANRSPSWTVGSPEYASNKYGRAVNFSSDVVSFGDVELFPSATATLLIIDKPVNLTQAAGLVNKRPSATSQHSLSIGYNYNSSSELCVDIGSATGAAVAISYRFSLSKFSTNGNIIFVVIDVGAGSGAKVRLFVNGVEETSKTVGIDTVLSAIPNTTAPFEIGRVNNGTNYYAGHINRVAAWSRALSWAEVAALYENPWQLFRPLNRSIYFLPAESGVGSTAYSLTAAHGSYSLSGQAVTLTPTFHRSLALAEGSYTLSGQAVGLTYMPGSGAYGLTLDAGQYTLAGQGLATRVERQLTAAAGVFTLAGGVVGLTVARQLAASAGTYTITGQDIALTFVGATHYSLPLGAGAYIVQGQDVVLRGPTTEVAYRGAYAPDMPRRRREKVDRVIDDVVAALEAQNAPERVVCRAKNVVHRVARVRQVETLAELDVVIDLAKVEDAVTRTIHTAVKKAKAARRRKQDEELLLVL